MARTRSVVTLVAVVLLGLLASAATSAPLRVSPRRLDLSRNSRIRVKWDGKYIAGISRASGLKRTTEAVAYREGGAPSVGGKAPGPTYWEPITLERGMTNDTAFEDWAGEILSLRGDPEVSLKNFRKDVTIELCNAAGQVVLAYRLHRCWVSGYQVLPQLDADANAVAIESITLEYEGWERDREVREPVER